ncbi:MAG: hypothetical protein ACFB9N_07495 [Geitlerinemataceae cyanobacterium]
MLKRLLASCLTVFLALAIAGCDRFGPNADLPLEAALLRQAQFGQEQLVGQLRFDLEPTLRVRHIRVRSRRDFDIQGIPSYAVRGTYDLELEFPSRTLSRQRQPFELYLQPQAEGTTWRLAKLDDAISPPQWRTYLLSGTTYDAEDFSGAPAARVGVAPEKSEAGRRDSRQSLPKPSKIDYN